MATTRSKAPWVAPRSGGYSAVPSGTTKNGSVQPASATWSSKNSNGHSTAKPSPPAGRASASAAHNSAAA